jgi:hypothetical protein
MGLDPLADRFERSLEKSGVSANQGTANHRLLVRILSVKLRHR